MADLTTLGAVKALLGIQPSLTKDDDLLQSLVSAASGAMSGAIGRDLLLSSRIARLDGNGKDRLLFPEWPVSAVASVKINGRAIPPAVGFGGYGYRFDETLLVLDGAVFERGRRNIELAYTAGYATIPADIAMACAKVAAGAYKERERLGISSKSLAGESISFQDVASSPGVRAVLDGYSRVTP